MLVARIYSSQHSNERKTSESKQVEIAVKVRSAVEMFSYSTVDD
jgi:hypothetical protein